MFITSFDDVERIAEFKVVYSCSSSPKIWLEEAHSWGNVLRATADYGVEITSHNPAGPFILPDVFKGKIDRELPRESQLWLFTVSASKSEFWPQGEATIQGEDWHFDAQEEMCRGRTLHLQMFMLGVDGVNFAKLYRDLNLRISSDNSPWQGLRTMTWDTRPVSDIMTLFRKS